MFYSAKIVPQVSFAIIGELILAHYLQTATFKSGFVSDVKIFHNENICYKNTISIIFFNSAE